VFNPQDILAMDKKGCANVIDGSCCKQSMMALAAIRLFSGRHGRYAREMHINNVGPSATLVKILNCVIVTALCDVQVTWKIPTIVTV
jgi:hypothetical protein